MFVPKRYDVRGDGEDYVTRNIMIYNPQKNAIRVIKSRRMRWTGRGDMHTGFWCGDLRERVHLEHLGVEVSITLKWIFKK
jgi:hypothetical protein